MDGPIEAFRAVRVAFIVDLELVAVHEPGPGSLDDPSLWEGHERVRVDAPHGLGVDFAALAVPHEGVLEAAVAPRLLEPARLAWPSSNTAIPPVLSDVEATTTTTAISSPSVSTRPNVMRPEIFFRAS